MLKYLNRKAVSCLMGVSILLLSVNAVAEDLPLTQTEREEGLRYMQITKDEANTQLDFLMANSSHRFEAELKQYGTFYPYGAVVNAQGKVNYMRIQQPDPKAIIQPAAALKMLRTSLQAAAQSKQVIGVALYYLTRDSSDETKPPIQAVSVEMEHAYGIAKGRAVQFVVEDGVVKYGKSATKDIPLSFFKKSE